MRVRYQDATWHGSEARERQRLDLAQTIVNPFTATGLAKSVKRFTAGQEVEGSTPGAGPSRGLDDHVTWRSRIHWET